MSHEETGAAMELQGFTGTVSSMHQRHGALELQAVFREMSAPAYVRVVAVYYKESGGLACVVVDALCGPLVSMDGMQLVGRVPSELTDEFHDYQEGRGMSPMISVEGDAATGIACSPSWTAPWPTSEAPAQNPSLPRPRPAGGMAGHNDVSMAVAHLYRERDFRKSQVA